MKKIIFKEALKKMSKLEDNSIIIPQKGLSISAVLCDIDKVDAQEINYNSRITHSKDNYYSEYEDREIHYTSHAEYRVLEKWKSSNIDLSNHIIIVTIPPCDKCLELILELKIDKVYYLYHHHKHHKHKFRHYRKIGLNKDYIQKIEMKYFENDPDTLETHKNMRKAIKKIRSYLFKINKKK